MATWTERQASRSPPKGTAWADVLRDATVEADPTTKRPRLELLAEVLVSAGLAGADGGLGQHQHAVLWLEANALADNILRTLRARPADA